MPEIEGAVSLLSRPGNSSRLGSPVRPRKFVSEVMKQVQVKDKQVVGMLNPAYLPLFVLDRAKKLSVVVGPAGFEPTTNRL